MTNRQLSRHIRSHFERLGYTVVKVSYDSRNELWTVETSVDTFRFEVGSNDGSMPFHSLTATVQVPLPD